MRTLRILAISAPLLVLSTSGLFVLAGCDSAPAPGTVASPIDKAEAAKQNQAMEDFMKGKKGKTPAKYATKTP
ncbi:hypothetical protein [Paludisphaera borealis]|uniref:Uncharacterized protein n=1 Tax=Paludisphaera borealis TaxID=1387353 RepID=A0A1U7CSK6_9BACT|nr:hypothetical protein [Paludisphaera borealis]APW61925.1 hypothetical protein BSF38_03457 [Paludisphaera borealis]